LNNSLSFQFTIINNSKIFEEDTFFIILTILFTKIYGQDSIPVHKNVYNLNYKIEIPLTVGLFALNYYGFGQINQKSTLDTIQITSLNKNDIWAFDRRAVEQSTSSYKQAQKVSDWGAGITVLAPALLLLDKDIRRNWLDVSLLYFETQAINSNLYTWYGPVLHTRVRPFVYYEELPFYEKSESGTTDSFFSGHTSWTAGASFFMAKVYSDFHPKLGGKKWWLFAAALFPPVFVGYHRYLGLKHFPTDIIVGTAIGAASGILTPHIPKIKKNKKTTISISPYSRQYSGLAFRMKF